MDSSLSSSGPPQPSNSIDYSCPGSANAKLLCYVPPIHQKRTIPHYRYHRNNRMHPTMRLLPALQYCYSNNDYSRRPTGVTSIACHRQTWPTLATCCTKCLSDAKRFGHPNEHRICSNKWYGWCEVSQSVQLVVFGWPCRVQHKIIARLGARVDSFLLARMFVLVVLVFPV